VVRLFSASRIHLRVPDASRDFLREQLHYCTKKTAAPFLCRAIPNLIKRIEAHGFERFENEDGMMTGGIFCHHGKGWGAARIPPPLSDTTSKTNSDILC